MVAPVRRVGLSLGLMCALVACEESPSPISGVAAPTAPAPTPPTRQPMTVGMAPGQAPAAPAAGADDGLSGTVVETMDASSYTYAKLQTSHGQVWVAGPATKLVVGQQVGRMTGQAMNGFRSDTLNRTFDEIYFVNAYAVSPGAAATGPTGAPAQAHAAGDISGTVTETMSSGGYTYALLDHAGSKVWIAGPEAKLAVGTKLGSMSGQLMSGFRSDTLKRTFDQIYFVSGFVATDGGAAGMAPDPHGAPAPATPAVAVDKIAPVAGGTAIADVFAKKAALAGKPVTVHGKVVKVNDGILGRNWLHLRDGSGGPGTNDLLVTSASTAKVGDVVTAKGVLGLDKDFGAGYRYDVIVEDSALTTP